jgi:hypothetical protein
MPVRQNYHGIEFKGYVDQTKVVFDNQGVFT